MSEQTELTDRDLHRIRLRFLDLLKSFFQDEPDAERLSRWRGIFAALDGQRITRDLDNASHELGKLLASMTLQQIKEEHYALFVNPYSKQLLPLTAAYYIDGKSFGPSLARYRDILKEAQVIKEHGFTDSEDSLPIMLDVLIALIQEEKQGDSNSRQLQDQLLREFLIPTVTAIEKEINTSSDIAFYVKCIAFLKAYLDLEQGLFEEYRK
jgi:TorA maturation chaperone TorD